MNLHVQCDPAEGTGFRFYISSERNLTKQTSIVSQLHHTISGTFTNEKNVIKGEPSIFNSSLHIYVFNTFL